MLNNSKSLEDFKERYNPGSTAVKNPLANAGDTRDAGLIPWLGRLPGGGNGKTLQYSCLGNPWTEELGGLQTMVSQKSDMTENIIKHILVYILKLWLLGGEINCGGQSRSRD